MFTQSLYRAANRLPYRRLAIGILVAAVFLIVFLILIRSQIQHFFLYPPLLHKAEFNADTSRYPLRLAASASRLLDPNGNQAVLKGLMAPEPTWLYARGLFNEKYFQQIHAAGARVIRVPVFPNEWEQDGDYLWRYLDPVVAWAGQNDMYVIIDWHVIGNITTGAGAHMPPLKENAKALTLKFWQLTAHYFRNTPNVMFEIWNEPESISAGDWRQEAAGLVKEIRDQGANQVVIVGGINFAKDLSWELSDPIPDPNLAFAAHIYPGDPQSSWAEWFGNVADKYPVILTEWGFMDHAPSPGNANLVGSLSTYARPLMNYLDLHHMSWVACWYNDQWLPPMFQPGLSAFTDYGEFAIQQLRK